MLDQAFQDSQANTFVSSVTAAHRWLGAVDASYGFGCLVGPLVATAIAAARPERWTAFYGPLLGLGVLNLGFVVWTFCWRKVGLGLGTSRSRKGQEEERKGGFVAAAEEEGEGAAGLGGDEDDAEGEVCVVVEFVLFLLSGSRHYGWR